MGWFKQRWRGSGLDGLKQLHWELICLNDRSFSEYNLKGFHYKMSQIHSGWIWRAYFQTDKWLHPQKQSYFNSYLVMSIIIQSELTREGVALFKLMIAEIFKLVLNCRSGEQISSLLDFLISYEKDYLAQMPKIYVCQGCPICPTPIHQFIIQRRGDRSACLIIITGKSASTCSELLDNVQRFWDEDTNFC